MAKKISELTAITTIADNDLTPIVDTSETETKKMTASQMKTYAQGDLNTRLTTVETNGIIGATQYGGTIVTNLNTISKGGFYTALGTATGVPNSNYSWFITHQNSNANTNSAYQRAVAYSTDLIIYERTMQGGTWGTWENVNSGWLSLNRCTFTYTSFTSATYTAVMSTSIDLTDVLSLGMKMRLVQSSTTKYGIITAISSNSITLFMGTDYILANATISNVYYSDKKAPYGFPTNPDKWTLMITNATDITQTNPTQNTWYNLGGIYIDLPKGVFDVCYVAYAAPTRTTADYLNESLTLSTANNTANDKDLISRISTGLVIGTSTTLTKEKRLVLTASTRLYLNAKTDVNGVEELRLLGNYVSPTIIQAVCAYL